MSKARKRIKSAEKDVELLLSRFTKDVQQGAELSFATFKRVWVDLHFSYIFLGNNTDYKNDQFIQCLYASALDGLDIPLWQLADPDDTAASPGADRQPATAANPAVAPQTHAEGATAPAREPSISYHDLSNLMLSDDSDDSEVVGTDRHASPAGSKDAHALRQHRSQQQSSVQTEDQNAHPKYGRDVPPNIEPLADLQPVLGSELPVRGSELNGDESAALALDEQATEVAGQAGPSLHTPEHANANRQAAAVQRTMFDVSQNEATESAAVNRAAPSTEQTQTAQQTAHVAPPSRPPVNSLVARATLRQRRCQTAFPQAPSAAPLKPPLIASDPSGVPFETKIGSLFALYCLFEAQPGKVPIYLPLELLLQLLRVLRDAQEKAMHDVAQVMLQLMRNNAFVVGAVRRPVRGSKAAEAAAQPPCRMAASSLQEDTGSRNRVEREAKYHMLSTLRGLTLVDRLHGMCQDYTAAKKTCFAALSGRHAKPPQAISKATLGLKLGQLLSDATKAVDSKLYPPRLKHRQKRKRSSQDDADHADNKHEDAAPASDIELDNILENSMAALASDDEQEVNDADELAGLDEEGDFDLGDVLAGIRGKAARAVIQRDMKRKQQARAASLAWQRYESTLLQRPPDMTEEPDSSSPGPASRNHNPLDHSSDVLPGFDVDDLYSPGASRHSNASDDDSGNLGNMQDAGLPPKSNSDLPFSSRQRLPKALPAGREAGKDPSSSSAARPAALPQGPRSIPLRPVVKGKRTPKRKRTLATDVAQQDQQAVFTSDEDAEDDTTADNPRYQSTAQASNSAGRLAPDNSLQLLASAAADAQRAQHEVPQSRHVPSVNHQQPGAAGPKKTEAKAAAKPKSGKTSKSNQQQKKAKSTGAKRDQLGIAAQQQQQQDGSADDMDDPTGPAKPAVIDETMLLAAAAEISSFLAELSE